MVDQDQANSLWAAWQTHARGELRVELRVELQAGLRAQLVDLYLPFARMMAAKLYARRPFPELEFMDYLQYASLGLLESIDRFDPRRGVTFETYAGVRIKGAVLSGIQSLSERQEQVHARQRLINERVQQLQTPADPQPDQASGVPAQAQSIDDVFACLAELAMGLAMGFVLEDTGMMLPDENQGYHDFGYQRIELRQLQERMRHYLAALPEKENRVLSYHYLQHLGFEDIARILGLSKGRISQIHKQALERMRGFIAVQEGVDIRY